MLARITPRSRPTARDGTAAVELAAILPFLVFLVGVGCDFARVFYCSQILDNCARNGAIYESDKYFSRYSPYPDSTSAALADAPDLKADPQNLPTVSVDKSNPVWVVVTVKYKFQTIARFVGIPNSVEISRTVQMAVTPDNPDGT